MRMLGVRVWSALGIVLLALGVCSHAQADGGRVPVSLQAQLTARVGAFDRNFKGRAGAVARVTVIHKNGHAESEIAATGFARAMLDLHIGGLPVVVEELAFTDPVELANRCRSVKSTVVYFSVGLEQEMARVAAAFVGLDVLTVGATALAAVNGAVVGFDVEEARPKLVLNVRSAKAQNVAFKAELLELARIVP